MTYFVDCRTCGHTNPPDAKVCVACHNPLDPGIRDAMNCPMCGTAAGAGSVTCRSCGFNLEGVERIPRDQRTLVCPYCKVANPPPVQSDAAAYCISCGREIQLPGPEYGLAEFTPDKDVCPTCGKTGVAVSLLQNSLDSIGADLFRPPTIPAVLRGDGLSSAGSSDVDTGGDGAGLIERVWNSEVGAIRSFLGASPPGASAEQVASARYRMSREIWQAAYYCDVDNIVFARRLHTIRKWSPQDFAQEIRSEAPPGAS